ncbi:ABC transporter permease [Maricaulis salignorans]|uniref:ABC-2 type transport system permease protein n=1 Tax=Maricaulis salignorans TaxID=144026 RepID=A0A1G9WPA5_9PROT|nr:ABC transporter permease [Maricaulis salignorans]SDM86217.1 ABC-2 type transport system permease protein [Maricaulis salignorans]
MNRFASLNRIIAILRKEFIQMTRDRLTFGMMVGIPVMQLLLFGYAINTDARHLPTLVEMGDSGPASRAIIQAMETSEFFDITGIAASPEEADIALRDGTASFVVTIPPNFERDLARGERPQILLDSDGSDPVAAGAGSGAFAGIVQRALEPYLGEMTPPVETVIHRRYNPAGRTALNIVPGLLGTILTLTMAMMTSISLTREAERGTLEALLSTPTEAFEVMIGKITPYVFVGSLQVAIMLAGARFLFGVPFLGSPLAFVIASALFIVVNLALGFLFSTVARSQMQAMQLTMFLFMPSFLLSGFMFPFAAMPQWAQALGQLIPTTHYIRVVRAVMLKGAELPDVWPSIWPMIVMCIVIAVVAIRRYRRTLD